MLSQIATPFETFMVDDTYDGESVSQAVLDKQTKTLLVIPPHDTAVCAATGDSQRDEHIRSIVADQVPVSVKI